MTIADLLRKLRQWKKTQKHWKCFTQPSSGCIRPAHDAPSSFISCGTWRFIPGALTGPWAANSSFRESAATLSSANGHRLHRLNLFDGLKQTSLKPMRYPGRTRFSRHRRDHPRPEPIELEADRSARGNASNSLDFHPPHRMALDNHHERTCEDRARRHGIRDREASRPRWLPQGRLSSRLDARRPRACNLPGRRRRSRYSPRADIIPCTAVPTYRRLYAAPPTTEKKPATMNFMPSAIR